MPHAYATQVVTIMTFSCISNTFSNVLPPVLLPLVQKKAAEEPAPEADGAEKKKKKKVKA